MATTDIRRQLFEQKPLHELNMTALMDITFLLLLVFIVTFPMVENATPVKLPTGQGQAVKPGEMVTITRDPENRITLDGRLLTVPELEEAAARLKREKPDTTVLLRFDESVTYGKMNEVTQALIRGGLTKIALANAGQPSGPVPPGGSAPPRRSP